MIREDPGGRSPCLYDRAVKCLWAGAHGEGSGREASILQVARLVLEGVQAHHAGTGIVLAALTSLSLFWPENVSQHFLENPDRNGARVTTQTFAQVGGECAIDVRRNSHSPTPVPQHISDTDMGRERPRRSALGPRHSARGGVAHAPSLLRHLCWGAYRAAQTAARPGSARPASTSAPSMDCGASVTAVAAGVAGQSGNRRHCGMGGQPRLGLASPSSAPFVGDTNRHGDDDGRVSARP